DDQVGVRAGDVDGAVDPGPADVAQLGRDLLRAARVLGHPDRGDVQEGDDARRGDLDDVAAEGREGRGAGRAGVDGGRAAAGQAVWIGLHAERRNAPEDVRVQIDQAGRDDRAGRVEQLARAAGGQVLAHGRDLVAVDRHVQHAVDPLAGI